MTIRLKSPRVRVVLGDPEEPGTWEELTVQCIGRDIQATERLLSQLKLGNVGQNQITAQAMFGYHALRRLGRLDPGTSWSDFEQVYLEVTDPLDEAPLEAPVHPTSPAAGTAS